jgi:hypothetical protein
LLHKQVAAFTGRYNLVNLLSELPRLYFPAADSLAADTRRPILKTVTRTVHTLQLGSFIAHEQILQPIHGDSRFDSAQRPPLHSEVLRRLVPPRCRYGYDLIVFCGLEFYLYGRQVKEIKDHIKQKNGLVIPASTVQVLSYKFLKYLGRLHHSSIAAIRHQMSLAGGYILHLDSTCEEKDPLLLSCIDGISGQVLYSKKIRSENKVDVQIILETVKELFGLPLAVVSDMGHAFVIVVAMVFPDIVHVICHYHFLRDLGRDFLDEDYDSLRQALSKSQIKAALRTLAKRIEKKLGGAENITAVFDQSDCQSYFIQANKKQLLQWYALQVIYEVRFGKGNNDGYGFPFDHPHLDYYERLESAITQVREALQNAAPLPKREKKDLLKLEIVLSTVMPENHDDPLRKTVKSLRERINIFDRFRQIMRLACKGNKQGLNDNGSLANYHELQQIEKELTVYTTRLERKANRDCLKKQHPQLAVDIKKMIRQIHKYWDMLFMSPIIVQAGNTEHEIVAQRTNNLMERSFRKIKRRCRRRHGRKKLQKDMATLPAEIALVDNLLNQQYVATVMGTIDKLPLKFAELDQDKSWTLKKMKNTDCATFSKKLLKQLQKYDVKNIALNYLQNGIV